jgi:hypothetical protein
MRKLHHEENCYSMLQYTRARVGVKRCHMVLRELAARRRLKVKGNKVTTVQIRHEMNNLSINGFANSSNTIVSVTRMTFQLWFELFWPPTLLLLIIIILFLLLLLLLLRWHYSPMRTLVSLMDFSQSALFLDFRFQFVILRLLTL